MKVLLKVIGCCLIASGMTACKGSGTSSVQIWDLSKLKGSWQAVSYKDVKANAEAKADENGYLGMLNTSDTSASSAPTYLKLFVTFDGSKTNTVVVGRDTSSSNETSSEYHIEGNNTLVSKLKNDDGSFKEDRAQITKLTPNTFEMNDSKGNIEKFKRVTDAVIQSAKASAHSADTPNNNACVSQQGLTCIIKPGLAEGQVFNLLVDLNLKDTSSHGDWNYFVSGQQVEMANLVKREGQDFCAVAPSKKHSDPEQLELPSEYQKNGVNQFPKAANPYVLTEISWYVETVFFKGKTPNGEPAELAVYCATIQNGSVNSKEQTSLTAIQKHLAGLISLQQ